MQITSSQNGAQLDSWGMQVMEGMGDRSQMLRLHLRKFWAGQLQ